MCSWLLSSASSSMVLRFHRPFLSVAIAFLSLSLFSPWHLLHNSAHGQDLDWGSEIIDETMQFGTMSDRSMQLDDGGNLHIIYGVNRLRYSYYDGIEWHYHVIDASPSAGKFGSIAVDALGHPHISYYDASEKDLRYATWNGTSWSIQIVDSDGDVGEHTSIAIASPGSPHISYFDASSQELKIAQLDGGNWDIRTVLSNVTVGPYTSLVFDDSNHAHIAFYDAANQDLRYVHWDGASWVPETVDSTGDAGKYCSLVLDALGHSHISYMSNGEEISIKHAYLAGDTWHIEIIDDQGYGGGYTALTVGPDSSLHIAYMLEWRLHYAWWNGSVWVSEIVPGYWDWSQVGYFASLSLDDSSRPHIVWVGDYWDGYNTQQLLKHSVRDSSGWQTEWVAWWTTVGRNPALSLDNAGFPCVAYHGFGLNFARWNGNTWVIEPVTLDADSDEDISLAIDPTGAPHICYQHDDSLIYARRNEDQWVIVAMVENAANEFSVDVDHDGHPHVSFGTSGNHWYAEFDGHSWEKALIEEQASGGSLRLDAQDNPHIVYQGPNGALRYAYSDGTAWIVESVDAEIGDNIDLQLDGSNRPHIGYQSDGGQNYAFRDETRWYWELVSEPEDDWHCSQGSYASIGLDASGRPRISHTESCTYTEDQYYSRTLFSYKTPTGWITETIGGLRSALAVDESGGIHLVGHSWSQGFYSGVLWHNSTSGLSSNVYSNKPEMLTILIDGEHPFRNPRAVHLGVSLPEEIWMHLSVFDLLGREVKSIHSGILPQGNHTFLWNDLDDRGGGVSSGTYIVSAEAGGHRVSKRIVLLR